VRSAPIPDIRCNFLGKKPEPREVYMHKRVLILAFAVFLVLSCGREPIFTFDLGSIVYQEGDFPAGTAIPELEKVERGTGWIYDNWHALRLRDAEGETVVYANVIVFTDKKERNKAYDEFTAASFPAEMQIVTPPDIGETIVARKGPDVDGGLSMDLIYQRCYSMVTVRARLDRDPAVTEESVNRYADLLDKRLNQAVCPI
jgi:hypothetical protein